MHETPRKGRAVSSKGSRGRGKEDQEKEEEKVLSAHLQDLGHREAPTRTGDNARKREKTSLQTRGEAQSQPRRDSAPLEDFPRRKTNK